MGLFVDKQALYRLDPARACVILVTEIKILANPLFCTRTGDY